MRFLVVVAIAAGLTVVWVPCVDAENPAPDLTWLPDKAVEAADWSAAIIDDTRDVGPHVSVAYSDRSRRTFISYYDSDTQDLWIAWSALPENQGLGTCGPDDNWFCFGLHTALEIGGEVGQYNDIAAMDSYHDTSIAVSYYDATNHSLRILEASIAHAFDAFGIQEPYTILTGIPASNLWVGKHTSVALIPDNDPGLDSKFWNWRPIIAFQKGNESSSSDEELMVARPVANDTGNCGEGEMLNDWQCDTLYAGEGSGQYASIDLDSNGNASVAFYDEEYTRPLYAKEVAVSGNCGPSNSWSCQSIVNGTDDTGKYVSLALEEDGTPHMAYYNASHQNLEYATLVGPGGNCGSPNSWWCSSITAMGSSLFDMGLSLDLTPSDNPVIAYQDASSALGPATLAIARPAALLPGSSPNCGPPGLPALTWVCEWLDSGGATRSEARDVSLVVSGVGHAMVAYHELDDYPFPAEGALKFTTEPRPLLFTDGFNDGHLDFWSLVVNPTSP